MGDLKRLKLTFLKFIYNTSYQICYYVFRPHPKRVTFATMRNTQLVDNLKQLYDTFEKNGDYELKVFCFHYDRSPKSRLLFFWYSLISVYYIATSHLFIIDDYFFPLYSLKKHRKNIVIQTWHAIGTLKKIGLSLPNAQNSVIKPHTNYDWVVVNTAADRQAYADAFDINRNHVLPLGEPMLDVIAHTPIKLTPKHTKKILYSPTYRQNDSKKVLAAVTALIKAAPELKEDWEIYISIHPYVNMKENLHNLPKNIHLFQDPARVKAMMPTMDAFITDYSSLLLNFSYFERPILLFTPDYQEYVQKQGFYVNYFEYLNAPFFQKAPEMMAFINEKFSQIDLDYVRQLKHKNFPNQDGHNSDRVYQFLTSINRYGEHKI
ncbi:ribitolphosphotransferase [Pediococcus ethanolidurans]|uniref:CDP-glycerol glycerophosphotransferase family protein n=1 Tax=Pediococcus ethanolidurans TaxID=319653 RepID=UPI002954E0F2|nr:CDP-glycerol glycerophosphotransferase family protein [Pediococcus ethanolidurans]MDV7718988.1 ribitolphosphotransferase [Pediococcus ethanolidurans]